MKPPEKPPKPRRDALSAIQRRKVFILQALCSVSPYGVRMADQKFKISVLCDGRRPIEIATPREAGVGDDTYGEGIKISWKINGEPQTPFFRPHDYGKLHPKEDGGPFTKYFWAETELPSDAHDLLITYVGYNRAEFSADVIRQAIDAFEADGPKAAEFEQMSSTPNLVNTAIRQIPVAGPFIEHFPGLQTALVGLFNKHDGPVAHQAFFIKDPNTMPVGRENSFTQICPTLSHGASYEISIRWWRHILTAEDEGAAAGADAAAAAAALHK